MKWILLAVLEIIGIGLWLVFTMWVIKKTKEKDNERKNENI